MTTRMLLTVNPSSQDETLIHLNKFFGMPKLGMLRKKLTLANACVPKNV